jgi:hypothetical protein
MKTLVIIVLSVVAFVVLLIGVAAAIGSRLPVAHRATRSIVIRKSSEEIYQVIRDVGSASTWRPDVKSVELLGSPGGKLNYREHGSQGDVTYEIVEEVANERMVTRIVDKDLGYSGSWTFVLTKEGGGTRVAVTENGEVSNVIFRFLSRYVFGHTSTLDGYLVSLAKRFGESATPQ